MSVLLLQLLDAGRCFCWALTVDSCYASASHPQPKLETRDPGRLQIYAKRSASPRAPAGFFFFFFTRHFQNSQSGSAPSCLAKGGDEGETSFSTGVCACFTSKKCGCNIYRLLVVSH